MTSFSVGTLLLLQEVLKCLVSRLIVTIRARSPSGPHVSRVVLGHVYLKDSGKQTPERTCLTRQKASLGFNPYAPYNVKELGRLLTPRSNFSSAVPL